MKKTKRTATVLLDESRPSKPAAPPTGSRAVATNTEVRVLTYDGPRKTSEVPQPRRKQRTGRKKVPLPRTVKPPPRRATEVEFGPQRPKRPRASAESAARGEQYIRMRIRVNNGRLSVIDSHLVDGPLGQATGFPGTNAYEVTLGDRLLHAGALPDLGVQRSFANPTGPREQHGHHLVDRPVYEFMARVPAAEVTADTIGQIMVRLHRVKEEARVERLGAAPLSSQFERELRPIAELVGLPASVLPEAIEKRGGRTPST